MVTQWLKLLIFIKWKWKSLSHVRLFETLWTVDSQAPLSMRFSRQEYWSGLPFPIPWDLPDPGIKPRSPALQADSSPAEPQESTRILAWVAYHFSSRSSQPRNWTGVSCIAGGFFTSWATREVPLISLWNYPVHKKLTTPYTGGSCLLRWHTLSVECASPRATLVFWHRWHSVYGIRMSLNKSPSYHFASSWIPSVVRHNLSFIKSWDQVCDF